MGPLRKPSPLILGIIMAPLVMLTGCQELQTTVDSLLGKDAMASSPGPGGPALKLMLAQQQSPPAGARKPPGTTAPSAPGRPVAPAAKRQPGTATTKPDADAAQKAEIRQGKKTRPGRYAPAAGPTEAREMIAEIPEFRGRVNPFDAPTELGPPSDCPPSRPLCRFDRSQLKLVGVIQMGDGQLKGLVEDPGGRGYFVVAGMQIGTATVTQITYSGITLQEHKFGGKDVIIPLYNTTPEGGDL